MTLRVSTSATVSRSIILFGGQGSPAVFSPMTLSAADGDARSSATASILLSRCHAAFLEDLQDIDLEVQQLLEIDLADFQRAGDLLDPRPKYHVHGVVEATSICLYQLLHYVAEVERSGLSLSSMNDQLLETTGLCAGLLPAAVIAASRTAEQFVKFGVEAFRLALCIAYRTTLEGHSIVDNAHKGASWSLVVSGLSQVQVKDELEAFHAVGHSGAIRISASLRPNLISVSGPSSELCAFRERLGTLGTATTLKFAHVHAWYHGGDLLKGVEKKVILDIERRGIQFVLPSDLTKPVRSTFDGSLFSTEGAKSSNLAFWVTRHMLIDCVNWIELSHKLSAMAEKTMKSDMNTNLQLISFGPSSETMLAPFLPQSPCSRFEIVDLSSFKPTPPRNLQYSQQDGIAIVGMGVNFPKGKGPQELWETLSKGLIAVQEIPESRFKFSEYYSNDDPAKDRTMRTRHGAFLDDIWTFDNTFFNISPRESKSIDPQQRVLLHTVQAALEDAGYVGDATKSFQRESMGCYIGVATGDYTDNLRNDLDVFYSPGTLRAFNSGRISYFHKFSGPSIVIDTACSSSFVAIYQACRALQNGDCTAALAGGVNTICSPDMYLGLSRGNFLSSNGGCKPFDASADGYCRAEGCGIFVLKMLSDAIIENDQIYGIIRDVMVNQSGTAQSITHPHSETQAKLMKRVLEHNSIDPSSVSVVEAHGTGTQAGDLREIAAIEAIFSQNHSKANPLKISSIKGNIGHCEAASGAASLAKVLLMMRKHQIPPQAGLNRLNPRLTALKEDQNGLIIPRICQPWQHPSNFPRRAMLNNFGAAGSNSILLLEEFSKAPYPSSSMPERSSHIFNISAKSSQALETTVRRLQKFLLDIDTRISIKNVCYTATARREVYKYRKSLVCNSLDNLRSQLACIDVFKLNPATKAKPLVFVFSGQGSAYEGMGAELFHTSPLFRETILRCESILQTWGFPSILHYISKVPDGLGTADSVDRTIVSQCACVALEYALAKTFISWGLIPDCVIGHSLGEFAALAISDAITLEQILKTTATRAEMMHTNCVSRASGMVACKLSPVEIEQFLRSDEKLLGLSVACENSKDDSVIAGPLAQLEAFERLCKNKTIEARRLDVPYGFHSSAMDPIVAPLMELGLSTTWTTPITPIVSGLSGRFMEEGILNNKYFALHVRQPVRFYNAVQTLDTDSAFAKAIYLEIGPHPIVLPMIRSTLHSESCTYLPTLQKDRAAWTAINSTLSQLSMTENSVKWRNIFDGSDARMTELPSYPLEGSPFQVVYQEGLQISTSRADNVPDTNIYTGFTLLPWLRPSHSSDSQFHFLTSTETLGPLISGHVVGSTSICPASVLHELILEGAQKILGVSGQKVLVVNDLMFEQPMAYSSSDESRPINVHYSQVDTNKAAGFKVTITELRGSTESVCCTGHVCVREVRQISLQWLKEAAVVNRQISYLARTDNLDKFQTRTLYEVVFPRVVQYSKEYQTITNLSVSESSLEGIGYFKLTSSPQINNVVVSPMLTDTLLHAAGFIANLCVPAAEVCICSHVESTIVLYHNLDYSQRFKVYCSLVDLHRNSFVADAFALGMDGELVAIIRGMEFKKLRLTAFQKLLSQAYPGPADKSSDTSLTREVSTSSPTLVEPSPSPITDTSFGLDDPSMAKSPALSTLYRIISNACGLEPQDLDSSRSLEELGIDSLMQMEITSALKRAFPTNQLQQDLMSQCETLQDLESIVLAATVHNNVDVQQSRSKGSYEVSTNGHTKLAIQDKNLITLQTSAENPTALYLFHDGSGQVSSYKRLLSIGRNVYAFFAPDSSLDSPISTLNRMAERYIDQIPITEGSSVILGGWSFGGVLAFEAAYVLTARGVHVRGIILIDSPYPINHTPLPDAVINQLTNSKTPRIHTTNIRCPLAQRFKHHASMLGNYHPARSNLSPPKGFKIVILRSKETFDSVKLCGVDYKWLNSQKAREEAVTEWEGLVGGPALVLPIPGNHFEAFEPHNIAQVSAQLRHACEIIEYVTTGLHS